MIKKIVSFRLLLLIFISLVLGILCGGFFLTQKILEAIITLSLIFITILTLFIITIYTVKNKNLASIDIISNSNFNKNYIKNILTKIAIILLSFLLGVSIIFANYGINANKYISDDKLISCNLEGRISGFTINEEKNYININLENIQINSSDIKDIKIKVFVYEYGGILSDIKIGNIINFTSTINKNEIITSGEINMQTVLDKIIYYTFVNSENV